MIMFLFVVTVIVTPVSAGSCVVRHMCDNGVVATEVVDDVEVVEVVEVIEVVDDVEVVEVNEVVDES